MRYNDVHKIFAGIAPHETLRQLLGERFKELVSLHGVVLVRGPDDKIVSPVMYKHQLPSSDVATGENDAPTTPNTTEAATSTNETLKRKATDDGQENQLPRAKRIEVIDLLGDSP